MGLKIGELINFWKCCLFNAEAIVTVLPAFLLAGAVVAFIPPEFILRHLGRRASPLRAYGVAAAAGYFLSICSCNIVPLFIGIKRRGAGLGPAITFLYAGPAINLLSLIFVAKIVGPWMGVIRGVLVPVMAIVAGLIMALLFERREESPPIEGGIPETLAVEAPSMGERRAIVALFALLLVLMVMGGVEAIPLGARLSGGLFAIASLAFISLKWIGPEKTREWMREVWLLAKMVLPILIPMIILIAIAAQLVPVKWVVSLWGRNDFKSALNASLFGSLMYFPILTEVPFVKALLKDLGMAPGPALSMLLTAPGLSLAGMAIVWRELKLKRLLAYWAIIVALSTLAGWVFGVTVGKYICPCMLAPK